MKNILALTYLFAPIPSYFKIQYPAVQKWLLCALLLPAMLLSFSATAQTTLNWWSSMFNLGGGSFPRATKLSNGDWLATFQTGDGAGNQVAVALKSTNSCATFELISVLSLVGEGRDIYTPDAIQLGNGTILMAVNAYILDPTQGWGTNYQIRIYQSTDLGTNWTYLSTVDAYGNPPGHHLGLWEPDFHISSDGRLVCMWSDETYNAYSQLISESISADGGVSWSTKTIAVSQPGGGSLRPGMPQVDRMANGNYMLVFEVVAGAGSAYKISSDGMNWTAGLGTTLPDQKPMFAPFVCAMPAPDSRVFVTGMSGPTLMSSDYGANWAVMNQPVANTDNGRQSIYLSKPGEMLWLMETSSGIGAWRGSINPGPVELTTSRECHLLQQDGKLRTFICQYPDGSVWTKVENTPGGSWGSWTSLGGSGFRRLDAMQWTDGTMTLFGVGDYTPVWINWQNTSNGPWNGFVSLVDTHGNGASFNDFKAFKYNDGRCSVFGMDGNRIWSRSQVSVGSAWGDWTAFPGTGFTQVSPIKLPDDSFLMFGVGNETPMWINWQLGFGQAWAGWAAMGGSNFRNVRTFRYSDGRLSVFAGDGNFIYNVTQYTNVDHSHWGAWNQVPGTKIPQFDVIKRSDEQFVLLSANADGSIGQNVQTSVGGTSWSGWSNLGGSGFTKVDGGQLPDGRLYYFGSAIGSPEWLRYQQVSNGVWYVNWTNLGSSVF